MGFDRKAIPFVFALGDPSSHRTKAMNEDWSDALLSLHAAGARFLVVGAHAMAVHGVPRATQDLDVWVEATAANAEKVWQGLVEFGAPLGDIGVTPEDFLRPGTVVQIGLPPNRIDILTEISGVGDFADAWESRVEQTVRDVRIAFLGRESLLANKRAARRLKDLADIEALGG